MPAKFGRSLAIATGEGSALSSALLRARVPARRDVQQRDLPRRVRVPGGPGLLRGQHVREPRERPDELRRVRAELRARADLPRGDVRVDRRVRRNVSGRNDVLRLALREHAHGSEQLRRVRERVRAGAAVPDGSVP